MLDNSLKNKKIVFKVPEFPHVSETFIVAQLITAIKLGYEIQIITRKTIDFFPYLLSGLIDEYKLFDKIIIEDYGIPKNRLLRLTKWFFLLGSNLNHLKSIIRYHRQFSTLSLTWLYQWCFYFQFNDASIIHVQYGTNSFPFRILKKKNIFKPNVIVTFHGHDAFFPLYGYIPNDGYYEKLFSNETLITANTSYLTNKILGLGCPKENIVTIPVGVDTSFFYPNQKEGEDTKQLKLITVGRLDAVKGHRYCIEVVSELIKQGVDVTLSIIGEGLECVFLEKLISKLKLEGNVLLLGKKSPTEVREYFWNHDIYLLLAVPLPDGRRETQGLATLEAQACGLPAIVFDSGGVKNTVVDKRTGFICREFDIQDVVQKVKIFYIEKELIKEMGAQATIFVNKVYSQKIIEEKWRYVYEKQSIKK